MRRLHIVVTGGAGFIGSHLCDKLIEAGHEVTCIDNLYSGREENIRALRNNSHFRFRQADVQEPIRIPGLVDRVYNLACPASPVFYQRDPIGTMRTCILGAYHVLELGREKNARVLQASTSEIYGDPEVHPQVEEYEGKVNTTGPRACYDEGKRAAETMFFDYHRQYKLPIKVARIFNTYGPRMLEDDGRVVSNFIVQTLRQEAITIYGDGSQTRSFCYVDDLVQGLISLMETPESVTGPINLGNPHEVTMRELALQIKQMTNSKQEVEFCPLPQDDPRRRQPNIDKARKLLGWSPITMLEEGLRSTVEYFRQQKSRDEAKGVVTQLKN